MLLDEPTGEAILCDFGTSKKFVANEESVSYIATREYRAPELMFCSKRFGTAIDVWSAGCALVEMLRGRPLFTGDSHEEVRAKVMHALGTPTMQDFEDMRADLGEWPKRGPRTGKGLPLGDVATEVKDLIDQIFVYSPQSRITAADAARHPCFARVREGKITYNGRAWRPPQVIGS
jgi:glycogen synthase kinase 3 beta